MMATAEAEVVVDRAETGLARIVRPAAVALEPVMNVQQALDRLKQLQTFVAEYLKESRDGGNDGGDYGVMPGTKSRKVLFKSGADKLCDVYGLADKYVIDAKVEDYETGLFDYLITCKLYSKLDESFVGSGMGSCSSFEAKYRWRAAGRTCPTCQAEGTIIKGKAEYGGGWICFAKKGGCGAKFADRDPAIVTQEVGRVPNPDIIDTKNTVLKIAKKRAKIDAVIGVTRSSGIFTQDLEDANGTSNEPPATEASEPDRQTESHDATRTQAEKVRQIKERQAAHKQEAASHAPAETAAAPSTPAATTGAVTVQAINVRNGPLVVKDGKSVPSWGPLYVITFNQKVKASDGTVVAEATTFSETLAQQAESVRDAKTPVLPKIEPGKKKGMFSLMALDLPVDR